MCVISINGNRSQPKHVVHDVPAGISPRAYAFLAMINDLDLYGSALLFADDTTLVARSGDPVEAALHAEQHLSLIKAWPTS